jgi:hypothetical protein
MSVSEIIKAMVESGNDDLISELQSIFPDSIFGLLVHGLPKGEHGQIFNVDDSGSITMPLFTAGKGKSMIKLCADPEIFNINYPGCFNVTMSGQEAIEMAEKSKNVDGIVVCSATSFHSYLIYKDCYMYFKNLKNTVKSKKWWRPWK